LVIVSNQSNQMNRRQFILSTAASLIVAESFAKKTKQKLSFSTLGCPDWTWEQILENASKWGFSAIELRGIGKEIDLLKCPEFSEIQIKTTLKQVKDKGLRIINLGSSANLHFHEPEKRKEQLDHAKRYIDLAVALECPYIRVFPNNLPKEYPKEATLEKIASALTELSDYAKGKPVKILLETHGDVVKTDDLTWIMKQVNAKNVRLIWDFFNMYVVTKQPVAEMYAALKPYIEHVHVKDGIIKGEKKIDYVFCGEGDGPVKEAIEILRKDKFAGFYSFEWEKRWHPEIALPELAFPKYVEFMKN
jgi:sugar phosphate isomerase/epimerase